MKTESVINSLCAILKQQIEYSLQEGLPDGRYELALNFNIRGTEMTASLPVLKCLTGKISCSD